MSKRRFNGEVTSDYFQLSWMSALRTSNLSEVCTVLFRRRLETDALSSSLCLFLKTEHADSFDWDGHGSETSDDANKISLD